MSIASNINMYNQIVCEENYSKRKNDSINSILQYGRVIGKSRCVVFPASGFPYMTLCPRQCKGKVAITYLAVRTKNN